jgi:aldehyde:ferredoxin oxidoreductase
VAGKVFGVRRVPTSKGQAIPAYDPRVFKSIGITYATSPQGADHTAGPTWRAESDDLNSEGLADLSLRSQIKMAWIDTLGICIMGGVGFTEATETLKDLINGRYGWEADDEFIQELGRDVLRLERAFNHAAGFGPADDRLPEWITTEELPPNNGVFDVPEEYLDRVFDWE